MIVYSSKKKTGDLFGASEHDLVYGAIFRYNKAGFISGPDSLISRLGRSMTLFPSEISLVWYFGVDKLALVLLHFFASIFSLLFASNFFLSFVSHNIFRLLQPHPLVCIFYCYNLIHNS